MTPSFVIALFAVFWAFAAELKAARALRQVDRLRGDLARLEGNVLYPRICPGTFDVHRN